jgi:nitroreductase
VTQAISPASDARALLRANTGEWLGAVARRRSRRAFDGVVADGWQLDSMRALAERWRPHPDARAVLVEDPEVDIFTGVVGSYGKVVGAPHALVFIADERADFPDQHIGYTGEAVILEATRLGLATCWVGGFFSAKKVARLVDLAPGERVYSVSPLGWALSNDSATERAMAGLAGAHTRKSLADIAPGHTSQRWPQWAVAAIETARLAPSAVNRQPWRFRFEDGGLVIAKDSFIETPKVAKRLDIGIAAFHVDLAASACGVDGVWTDLSGSDVARFDPAGTA